MFVYLIFVRGAKDEPEEGPSSVDLKDVTMASLVEATVVEVGTVKPVQDFEALLGRGEDFNKGMQSHISGSSSCCKPDPNKL